MDIESLGGQKTPRPLDPQVLEGLAGLAAREATLPPVEPQPVQGKVAMLGAVRRTALPDVSDPNKTTQTDTLPSERFLALKAAKRAGLRARAAEAAARVWPTQE